MADKVYIDDLLLQSNVWKISQAVQTQLDTSNENTARSHNYHEAMDIYTNEDQSQAIYAPVKMVLKLKENSSNRVVYQSAEPVQFANGVTDYFCMFLCHMNDTDIPSINVNATVNKGTLIYKEGRKSGSNATGVGRHIHMQCGRGTFVEIKVGTSGYTQLYTTGGDLNPTELFLRTNSAMLPNHRRLKWQNLTLQNVANLLTTLGSITIYSSVCGTALKTVPQNKTLNIKLFEKKDYSGYTNSTDKYEWARASYTENGVTYAGFVQLDTTKYSLSGGASQGIEFSPCYQAVYLRTGLPSLDANGNVVKVETGKVLLSANPNTQLTVREFVPGIQVDGYCYAKVLYNFTEYYVQLDTEQCYVLSM